MRPSVNALFLCACLVVDPVAALPIPPSMRPSHFGAWRASHVTLQELAFLIIFVSGKRSRVTFLPTLSSCTYVPLTLLSPTALLFSVIGASLLTIFSRARSQAFVDGFSRAHSYQSTFLRLADSVSTYPHSRCHIKLPIPALMRPPSTIHHGS